MNEQYGLVTSLNDIKLQQASENNSSKKLDIKLITQKPWKKTTPNKPKIAKRKNSNCVDNSLRLIQRKICNFKIADVALKKWD